MTAVSASPTFSPELRLLLALTRQALGGAGETCDTTTVDWPRFVATVERHRLAPFLHARAGAKLATICPPAAAARLAGSAGQSIRRSLALTAEFSRLSAALADAGVPVFTIKGIAVAHQLHGQASARFAGDLDLVIAPEDAARADRVLRDAGLQRTWPEFPLTPRQHAAFIRAKPDFEYELPRPGEPLRVELLWRLEGVGAEPAFAAVTLAGRTARTLALEEHALLLFQHGARHAWFRLFWLVDIAELLRRDELDWTMVLARARRARSERALRQGVALAAELLGAPVPAALAAERPDPALLAEAKRQIVREPNPNQPFLEWARQLAYRVRLARGVGEKWRVLSPHLFTPLNWRVWRLPDRWFWLYYPATPFLWLWRLLRRR